MGDVAQRAVPTQDSHALAVALEPVLRHACEDRLGPIEWFASRWQRGGAATGFSTWRDEDGALREVVVKLPVGYVEHRWTTGLGRVDRSSWNLPECERRPTPRVLADGHELGGYDLAWIVMERLPGEPLAKDLKPGCIHELMEAAVDFQARSAALTPVEGRPKAVDWAHLFEKSKETARLSPLPEAKHWLESVKKAGKVLDWLINHWNARSMTSWCHGDLHAGNAMRRVRSDGGQTCVLIDLALVHPGHWVEDALYLERQFWGHSELLYGIKPVTEMARIRRERGMPASDNYAELANVRRVLTAAAAPALIEREGNPKYLHAALETLDRVLPQVGR